MNQIDNQIATSCATLSIEVCFGISGFAVESRHVDLFVSQVFENND